MSIVKTGPLNSTTGKDGRRFYTWKGERYWSVTTLLKALPKQDALTGWAKRFTGEFAIANLDEAAAMAASDPLEAAKWVKDSAYRARDEAAEIGTLVHDAIEAYILDKPQPEPPPKAAARMANFRRFLEKWQPVYELSECGVYNRKELYAGTLDSIAILNGARVLLDVKTRNGSNYPLTGQQQGKVWPDDALQVAAYRHAEFIGLPDGSEHPMPQVDACAILRIGDDDFELIEIDAGPDVFRTFLYVREVFRWTQRKPKSVLLGDFPATLEAAGITGEVAA